jgi:hypothetical protein
MVMSTIKSSWNEDRVAASYCNRRPAKKQGPRPSALYAQHKINTDIVTVFTRRGREVYTRRFGDVILSSRIDGDDLKVETVNGGRYVCDAWTGELLEAWPATETATKTAPERVSAMSEAPTGVFVAA